MMSSRRSLWRDFLSETVVDGEGIGKAEGEVTQEEMFVDSFLEETVSTRVAVNGNKIQVQNC